MLVLYGAMRSLPFELEESACLDGASLFTCFLKIIVPNVKAALATVSIFVFMSVWNEYNLALILLTKDDLKTLPLGLLFFQGEYTTDWGAWGHHGDRQYSHRADLRPVQQSGGESDDHRRSDQRLIEGRSMDQSFWKGRFI